MSSGSPTFTKKELAELLAVTPRQINNLVKEGMPQRLNGGRPKYGMEAVTWYYGRKLEEVKAERRNTSLDEARTKKSLAQAALAELELKRKTGEVIAISEVTDEYARTLIRLRGKILAVPGRWAPRFAPKMTRAKSQSLLEQAMRDAIDELRESRYRNGKRTRRKAG